MPFRPLRNSLALARLLASTVLPAILFTAAVPLAISAAQALTQDVVLENIKIDLPPKSDGKGAILIRKASFEGTNLSKEEIARFFSLANTPEDARALAAKMTAAKISIPEVVFNFEASKDKDVSAVTVNLKDFVATRVEQGKAAKIVFGGGDASAKKDAADVFKVVIGSYTIEDADFSSLLAALKQGDISAAMVKYSKVTFTGVDLSVVDKETPATTPGGNMMHFKLGTGSAVMSFEGDIFRKASGEVSSLSLEFPKASKAGQALAAFGYDKLDLGFKVSANYDPATKKLVLDDYTITGVNAGALSFKGQFGSIDPVIFTAGDKDARAKALMAADFSSMTLRFANSGLAEKGLAFAAAMQKKSPDALKGEITGMAKAAIPGVLGGEVGKKIADAIVAFIAAPKNLTVDIKAKGGALKFMDLANARSPQDVLPKVDLNAVANQ